ncbi:hypothetical protein PQQ75_25455 [Paraburkholderia aspalathi]|uniref:hypothetical protein n=1 Tax=Paraburkholderia aspalathi TaxID=1324617 RepID=UPI0038BB6CE4
MSAPFVRQLGAQPGIQLNPVLDNSDGFAPGTADQIFGTVMRATRGRIDKPFYVDAGTVSAKLGPGESMRVTPLNEAYVHVVEALNNGATRGAIQRLVPASAVLQMMVAVTDAVGSGAALVATIAAGAVTGATITSGGTNYPANVTIQIGGPGTGAVLKATVVAGVITAVALIAGGTGYTSAPMLTVVGGTTTTYSVAATEPGSFLFSVNHLECYNDGAKISYHADELTDANGNPVANPAITFRLLDANDVNIFGDISASLDPTAVDDYNNSLYLPDVVAALTDAMVLVVGAGATVVPNSDAYGRDANGLDQWSTSQVLNYFTEGGFTYATADYTKAVNALQFTPLDYGYIASCGSQSVALVSQLSALAYNVNTCFKLDVPGTLTPAEAIAWVAQLSLVGTKDYYCHVYWSPIKSADPTGINGNSVFGTSTFNIARACARNAQTDANGFAPKNYPIAGKAWPLNRTNMSQIYTPSDNELSDLAAAKINPVLFTKYNGGGLYVFTDSLTSATTTVSFKKLISVAEMSSSIDENVVMAGREFIQLPMAICLKKFKDFLKTYFEGAQAAGWLVPTATLNGAAFQYSVTPNAQKPADNVDVKYSLRFDGVARQITVTQTITK